MNEFVDLLLLFRFRKLPIIHGDNPRYIPFWRLCHPLNNIVLRFAIDFVKYPAGVIILVRRQFRVYGLLNDLFSVLRLDMYGTASQN